MSKFAEAALTFLQAGPYKESFSTSDLISNGFSKSVAKIAIAELEENGYICITDQFINGSVKFSLM